MSDLEARARAVHDYAESFVVVAGAGTGKTSLLVERVLGQLVETDLGVTEFAAITFTEKAAAEMRMRLEAGLARLVELVRDPAARTALDPGSEADRAWSHLCSRLPPDELRSRVESIQADLVHATISTIHGFCAGLLRQFPVEAGVDPDFSVDDGLLFDSLRRDLWHTHLASEHGPEGARAELWSRVLVRLDLAEVEALALALSAFDLPSFERPPPLPDARNVLERLVRAQLDAIDAVLPAESAPGPESLLSAARDLLHTLLREGHDAFRRALETARFQRSRGESGILEGADPTSAKAPESTGCAAQVRKLLRRLQMIDDALMRDVLELACPFALRVRNAARERSILPFDALLALARDMLATNPHVRGRLAERYRVLFVDEFQDTDPVQYEIVFFLAEEPEGAVADDAFQTRLARGKLFIVGDPKQAIYRFRGADIHAYHAAVRHVESCGGVRLALTTSWRAVPELLEPLDRLFPSLLEPGAPDEDDAYSGYEPLLSGRERGGDGPRVEIWTVGDESSGRRAEGARRDEATAVAEWIARQCGAGGQRFGDVALLFRSLRNLRLCTRALAERGVPFAVEAGRDVLERPEGRQLLALLRALANPPDAPALLGVLRSPLGGATDQELARYAASGGAWSYLEPPPDAAAFPNVSRCFAWLAERHRESQHLPVDALLCRLADETALLPLQAAAVDGVQRLASLRSLLDPLIELARAEPMRTLATLVPWLERGDTARRRVSPEDAGAVHIMSIHAAKGLEFPVVILPDLGRDPAEAGRLMGTRADVAWLPDLQAFALDTNAATSSTWLPYAQEEERHLQAESRRLFYVACTRAQERLILVHAPRARIGAGAIVHYLKGWGYEASGLGPGEALQGVDDVATRSVGEPGDTRVVTPAAEMPDLRGAVVRARDVARKAGEGLRPAFRSPSGLREQADAHLESDAEPLARVAHVHDAKSLGREVGGVIHQVLERWDFRDPEQARRLLDRAVATQAAASGRTRDLQEQAAGVLDALLDGDLPAYLSRVEVISRELPLLFTDESGQAWSGTIDLLYLDPDGRMVISDYKTDRDPDAASHESYRGQLEIYAKGIRKAFPDLPLPALELIYVRSGERVRLPERTIRA